MKRPTALIIARILVVDSVVALFLSQAVLAQTQMDKEKKATALRTTIRQDGNPTFLKTWEKIRWRVIADRSSKYPNRAAIQLAIDSLTQTLAADSSDPVRMAEMYFYVGQCSAELGQKDKAIAAYNEVIRVTPIRSGSSMATRSTLAIPTQVRRQYVIL